MKPTILIIDDIHENIVMLSSQLESTYNIFVATNEADAFEIACMSHPDLILINTTASKLDGYSICRRLKSDCALGEITNILIVNQKPVDFLDNSIKTGIVDYIELPLDMTMLMYRIRIHIDYKEIIAYLKSQRTGLKNMDSKSLHSSGIKAFPILAISSFAKSDDHSDGKHVMRTQLYVEELAKNLQSNSKYNDYLTDECISLIVKSAPLHDVGKVGIPNSIIMKPGPLTTEEFDVVKTHTQLGLKVVTFLEEKIPQLHDFMESAKEIVYSHHERWNGKGYPQGLKGEEIPISARIVSIADVYDALVSDRVYKKAFSHDTAVKIISDEAGEQFDPEMVAAFLSLEKNFKCISDKHKNE